MMLSIKQRGLSKSENFGNINIDSISIYTPFAVVGYYGVYDLCPVLLPVVEDDVNEVGDVQWNCYHCTEPEWGNENL